MSRSQRCACPGKQRIADHAPAKVRGPARCAIPRCLGRSAPSLLPPAHPGAAERPAAACGVGPGHANERTDSHRWKTLRTVLVYISGLLGQLVGADSPCEGRAGRSPAVPGQPGATDWLCNAAARAGTSGAGVSEWSTRAVARPAAKSPRARGQSGSWPSRRCSGGTCRVVRAKPVREPTRSARQGERVAAVRAAGPSTAGGPAVVNCLRQRQEPPGTALGAVDKDQERPAHLRQLVERHRIGGQADVPSPGAPSGWPVRRLAGSCPHRATGRAPTGTSGPGLQAGLRGAHEGHHRLLRPYQFGGRTRSPGKNGPDGHVLELPAQQPFSSGVLRDQLSPHRLRRGCLDGGEECDGMVENRGKGRYTVGLVEEFGAGGPDAANSRNGDVALVVRCGGHFGVGKPDCTRVVRVLRSTRIR